ncbi:O-antigen ligase family protein [Altererythrobacter sp.]|uniref:O-antigen ligase family protein n=1 Tax=Altererythrobacter sp. TaxID=1872480 RepID=UPI001B2C893D|nr:O-antigen ligase family protein [Altererythrobacter sp.]MBO6944612.1 O-antigen ligase family protein [Altererythrobacter sp.]
MITLRKFNMFGIVAIGCATWGLLVGDGRAAMAACLGAILLVEITKGKFFRFAFLLVPTGYFIFSLGTLILSKSPLAQSVSRSGVAADIETGNSRTLVWARAFEHLAENPTALLTGHGMFGHQAAGIMADNRFMSGFHGTDKALTLHSTSIQTLVDGGVLGLAFLTLILFLACRDAERFRSSRAMLCAAALMTCMMVNGIFDVWMTPYFDEGFYLFGLVTMALIARWPAGFGIKAAKKRPSMTRSSQPRGVGFDGRPAN